jgi:hypothetical protein
MRRFSSSVLMILGLAVVLAIPGCSSDDDLSSSEEIRADISTGAKAIAFAGPSADAAVDFVDQMLGLIEEEPPPAPGERAKALTCPLNFDLGNGITGTCSVSPMDVVSYLFEGTVDVNGQSTQVDGILVATPTDPQPGTGSQYSVDYDVTAENAWGVVMWSALGTATLDEASQVIDFGYDMSYLVMPAGHSALSIEVIISPSRFELIFAGPLGTVVRFLLERDTLVGTVIVGSTLMAEVAIIDNCVHVSFTCGCQASIVVCPW